MKKLVTIAAASLMLSLNAFAAEECATLKANFETANADLAVQSEILQTNGDWDNSASAENCQLVRNFEGILATFEASLEQTEDALSAYANSCLLSEEENEVAEGVATLSGLSDLFSHLVYTVSENCSAAGF